MPTYAIVSISGMHVPSGSRYAHLVSPAAKAAAGVNAQVLQLGQQLREDTLALQGGSGVALIELAVVGGHDLVARPDHVGVDETLNAVLQKVLLIHRLHGGLGHLQHD